MQQHRRGKHRIQLAMPTLHRILNQVFERLANRFVVDTYIRRGLQLGPFLRRNGDVNIDHVVEPEERGGGIVLAKRLAKAKQETKNNNWMNQDDP